MRMIWFSAVMFPGDPLPPPGVPVPGFEGAGVSDPERLRPMQPDMSTMEIPATNRRSARAKSERFKKSYSLVVAWKQQLYYGLPIRELRLGDAGAKAHSNPGCISCIQASFWLVANS